MLFNLFSFFKFYVSLFIIWFLIVDEDEYCGKNSTTTPRKDNVLAMGDENEVSLSCFNP